MVARLLMRGGSRFSEVALECCINKGAGLCKAFFGPCFFITALLPPRTFIYVLPAVFALPRIKQTAHRRCLYVSPPSSSSSSSAKLSEMSVPVGGSGTHCVTGQEKLQFDRSSVPSNHVQEFERLGYFVLGTRRVPETEKTLIPRGEIVVFEAFF